MKKIFRTSRFILFLLSLSLFSEDTPEQEPIDSGETTTSILALQQQNELHQSKNCTVYCYHTMNYRLPPDFSGVNTFAEGLVWQVQEQSSYFVATPNQDSSLTPIVVNNSQLLGDIQQASFKWSGGFRAGLGYTFVDDAWQLLGQYTWYVTEGKNSFTGPMNSNTQFLMSTITTIGFGPIKVSSSAHFSYQIGDLLLARRFLMNNTVQINPFLGATGGYIKEELHFLYHNTSLSTLTGPSAGVNFKNYVENSWQFRGGGFRVGTDANWHIGHGFGFFGRLSFAGILGQYININRITSDTPGISTFNLLTAPHLRDTKSKEVFLLPATQIVLGFDWSRACIDSYVSSIRIAIAGEFNHLSNLHVTHKTLAGPQSTPGIGKISARDISSVYIYGANLRLGIDF